MRDKKNISGTELEKFSHFYRGRVQFSEVDSFGVTHNLIYCYWLEWARTDYLRSIGIKMNPRTFLKEHSLMTVHSEIDYFSSSSFNDEYEVLSRIDWVKNSSLCFVNYIRLVKNNKILTRASSVLVNVDPQAGDSIPIGDDLRKMIKKFEQDNVKFIK